jgi:uncharacterized membrane protein
MLKKYTAGFVFGVIMSFPIVFGTDVSADTKLVAAVVIVSAVQAAVSGYMLIEELWKYPGGRRFVTAATKGGLVAVSIIFFPVAACILPFGLIALASGMGRVGSMVSGTAAMIEKDKQSMGSWT